MKHILGIYLRRLLWFFKKRKSNVIIGSKCNINLNSEFEGTNYVGKNSYIYNSIIGKYSYVGLNSNILYTKIGKYCSIGDDVKIVVATHPINNMVSTHPMFYSTLKQNGKTYVNRNYFDEIKFIDKEKKISVIIGNDVWIGNDATILGGVKIGDGAIIGAKALVVKDIEPYSIYGGVPAKLIRKRFTNDQIDILKKINWWDKSDEEIKDNIEIYHNIDEFIEHEVKR